jgi:hypothetical protein
MKKLSTHFFKKIYKIQRLTSTLPNRFQRISTPLNVYKREPTQRDSKIIKISDHQEKKLNRKRGKKAFYRYEFE